MPTYTLECILTRERAAHFRLADVPWPPGLIVTMTEHEGDTMKKLAAKSGERYHLSIGAETEAGRLELIDELRQLGVDMNPILRAIFEGKVYDVAMDTPDGRTLAGLPKSHPAWKYIRLCP